MRPVNLLPEQHRPAVSTGARPGSSYAVVGILVLVLALVGVYSFTAKQVSDRKAEAAQLSREANSAEAKVAALAPFGEFSDLKQARFAAVTQLATQRLDWERLVRELALVLPRHTWLNSFDGDALAGVQAAAAAGAAGAGSVPDAPMGPTLRLVGCAKDQPTVATMLVRLRRLNGAADVELDKSERAQRVPKKREKKDATGQAMPGGQSAAAVTSECGKNYGFDATVELEPVLEQNANPSTSREVPTSLGGGS
jgi:Tfp pilus assembly protein PilN